MRKHLLYRNLLVQRAAVNPEARTVDLAFSSGNRVDRGPYDEILVHDAGACDLSFLSSGSAPFLYEHERADSRGIIETASIDSAEKLGRASVRLSKTARGEELLTEIADGTRPCISVGYFVEAEILRTEDDGEPKPTFYITRWRPVEVSSVSLPADESVGIGRSAGEFPEELLAGMLARSAKETKAKEENSEIQSSEKESKRMSLEVTDTQEKARAAESARIREIYAISEQASMPADQRDKAIQDGTAVDAFRSAAFNKFAADHKANKAPYDVTVSAREQKQYSLARAVVASVNGTINSTASFEREISEEIARRSGVNGPKNQNGFFIPAFSQRANSISSTPDEGGDFIGTQHRPDMAEGSLFPRLVFERLGAQFIPNLVQNQAIPLLGTPATFYVLGETTDVTDSLPTSGKVEATPHGIGAWNHCTRWSQIQSQPAVIEMRTRELLKGLASGIEYQTINGSGAGSPEQVLGIFANSDVNNGDFASSSAHTYVDWLNMIALTETANAGELSGNAGFLTNFKTVAKGRTTAKGSSGALPSAIIDVVGRDYYVDGVPVVHTSNVRSNYGSPAVLSGVVYSSSWDKLVIFGWGAPEVYTDRSRLAKSGGIDMYLLYDIDAGLLQPKAFSIADNVKTTA